MLDKWLKRLGFGAESQQEPVADLDSADMRLVAEKWVKEFHSKSSYILYEIFMDTLIHFDTKRARPEAKRLELIRILLYDDCNKHDIPILRYNYIIHTLSEKLIETLDCSKKETVATAVEMITGLQEDNIGLQFSLGNALVKKIEMTWPNGVEDPEWILLLNQLKKNITHSGRRKDYLKLETRILSLFPTIMLQENLQLFRPMLRLETRPQLQQAVMDWLQTTAKPQDNLLPWLESCFKMADKSRPTDKWLKSSKEILQSIPEAEQVERFCALMGTIVAEIKPLHQLDTDDLFRQGYSFPEWLACIPWYSAQHLGHHRELRAQMEQLANWCFKKMSGVGPAAPKIGNACLYGFAVLPGMEGIGALLRFKEKSTNRNINKLTESLLDEAARKHAMQRGDMEDLSVPSFGLDDQQQKLISLGDYTARLHIHAHKEALLEWSDAKRKALKSVPSAVKTNHKDELKALQLEFKELQQTLQTQFDRLENAYLELRQWSLGDFEQRFLQHPVLRSVAARLIWQLERGEQKTALIWHEQQWQGPGAQLPDWADANTIVRLWHPLNTHPDAVLQWREWLENQNITQPFKQAYREIYVVTPPELRTETYSNRFAAQIVRQHQFNALAKQRNWQYHLQGQWDSHNVPFRTLANWNYRIEFWVEAVADEEAVTDVGMFLYLSTDQVRFYQGDTLMRVDQVPALLFSELMRDIDLFVGVCSIGNDPNWQDQGDTRLNTYWRRAAFSDELSESSKVRRQVLERLIPRLKIGPQCHFTDKFLVVKGTRHTYKIHCGSGNILRSPNDQYLCIVPASDVKNLQSTLYLPFEGDRMLSIIISKAMLLAEDDKITDTTILRQL